MGSVWTQGTMGQAMATTCVMMGNEQLMQQQCSAQERIN